MADSGHRFFDYFGSAWLFRLDRRSPSLLYRLYGLAGFAGQTALRSWMISKTLLAPIAFCVIALFLPEKRPIRDTVSSNRIPHILFIMGWVWWMVWNTYVLVSATSIRGSVEGGNRATLASIRSEIEIYKSDTNKLPMTFDEMATREQFKVPRLSTIAAEDRILHPATDKVVYFSTFAPNDTSGFGYVNTPFTPDGKPNPDFGRVFINCTHLNLRQDKRLADY